MACIINRYVRTQHTPTSPLGLSSLGTPSSSYPGAAASTPMYTTNTIISRDTSRRTNVRSWLSVMALFLVEPGFLHTRRTMQFIAWIFGCMRLYVVTLSIYVVLSKLELITWKCSRFSRAWQRLCPQEENSHCPETQFVTEKLMWHSSCSTCELVVNLRNKT